MPEPVKPLIKRSQAAASACPDLHVVDDLPRPVSVGRAELDVLEMYLGPALDALLRAMRP